MAAETNPAKTFEQRHVPMVLGLAVLVLALAAAAPALPALAPVVRLFHLFFGVLWIGLLYFFNIVNVPAVKLYDAPTRQHHVTKLMPMALFWFRYAALMTVVAGFGIYYTNYIATGAMASNAGYTILAGMVMGLIMFVNVWAIIWPMQKRVIAATKETVEKGTPAPADQPKWARRALLASRFNFILSVPMLFMMGAASHGFMPPVSSISTLVASIAVAGAIVAYLARKK
ncbi:MAG: urate hydroxylase PuuD [Halobacteria archaeon]